MHHARLKTSPRLQRALKVLREAKGEISSFDLILRARLVGHSATISELRANGAVINCRQTAKDGRKVFYYSLIKEPEHSNVCKKGH